MRSEHNMQPILSFVTTIASGDVGFAVLLVQTPVAYFFPARFPHSPIH